MSVTVKLTNIEQKSDAEIAERSYFKQTNNILKIQVALNWEKQLLHQAKWRIQGYLH